MRWAVDEFEHDFAHWDLHLPADAVDTRRGGQIRDAGWNIRYNFGADGRGEYLDYYASPRDVQIDPPSDDWHVRLYASGQRAELPTVLEAYMYGRDPTWEELERVRRQYLDRLEGAESGSAAQRAANDATTRDAPVPAGPADGGASVAHASVAELSFADPPLGGVAEIESAAIEPAAIEPAGNESDVFEPDVFDPAALEPAPPSLAPGELAEPQSRGQDRALDPSHRPDVEPTTGAPYLPLDIGLDVDLDLIVPPAPADAPSVSPSADSVLEESANAPAAMADAAPSDEIEIIPLETPPPLEIESGVEDSANGVEHPANRMDGTIDRATPPVGIDHEEIAPITLAERPEGRRDGLFGLGLIDPLPDGAPSPSSAELPSTTQSRPPTRPNQQPEGRSSELVLIFPIIEGPSAEDDSATATAPVASPPSAVPPSAIPPSAIPPSPIPTPAAALVPATPPKSGASPKLEIQQPAVEPAPPSQQVAPAGNDVPSDEPGITAGELDASEGDSAEPPFEPIPVGAADTDLPEPYDIEPPASSADPEAGGDGPSEDLPGEQSEAGAAGVRSSTSSASPTAAARARMQSGAPRARQSAASLGAGTKVFMRADPVLTADVAAIDGRVGPEAFAPWWLRSGPQRFAMIAAAVVVVAAVAATTLAHHRSRAAAAAQAARADSAEQDDTAPSPIRINPAAVLADSAANAPDPARGPAKDPSDTVLPSQNGAHPSDSVPQVQDRVNTPPDIGARASDESVARPSGPGSLPPIERSRPSTVHAVPATTSRFQTGAHP